jgi:hypothetical protein
MLDSPLVAGWKAQLLRIGKRLPGGEAFSPAATSRKRRTHWASADDALAHFASKKVFARWHPQVLQDYIAHGTHDEVTPQGTQRVLSFDRDVESAIYNTLPDHIESYLKRHPLKCKAALIGGLASKELKQVGLTFSQRITHGRIQMIDGTHLFPMEYPGVAAAAVEAAVLNLLA